MALAPGARLGPYEVLSLLGTGGIGEVYRAHDPKLKRDVATIGVEFCRRREPRDSTGAI